MKSVFPRLAQKIALPNFDNFWNRAQESSQVALENKVTLRGILTELGTIESLGAPLVRMSYFNPLLHLMVHFSIAVPLRGGGEGKEELLIPPLLRFASRASAQSARSLPPAQLPVPSPPWVPSPAVSSQTPLARVGHGNDVSCVCAWSIFLAALPLAGLETFLAGAAPGAGGPALDGRLGPHGSTNVRVGSLPVA